MLRTISSTLVTVGQVLTMQRIIDIYLIFSQKALEEERYDAAAQIRDKAGAGLVSFLTVVVSFLFCSSVMAEYMYLLEILEDFGYL